MSEQDPTTTNPTPTEIKETELFNLTFQLEMLAEEGIPTFPIGEMTLEELKKEIEDRISQLQDERREILSQPIITENNG